MILSTTPTIEGHPIREYRGLVTGETIIGTNFVKDFFASVRDVIGGRSGSYESTLREAKDTALREMSQRAASLGCNAIVGIDLDYETVGNSGSMLMVTCSGTAVIIVTILYHYCTILKRIRNEWACSSQLVPSNTNLPICAVERTCLPIHGQTS